MKLRNSIVGILIFLAFISLPALKAQDGLRGALSVGERQRTALAGRLAQISAADFDNDQKPDGALLRETGLLNGQRAFRIEIHITAGTNDCITFSSNETGLAISALDVNRDGSPDIVIERALTHERLQIYLNDGHGSFHKARTEDYPASDPSAPVWQARLNGLQPVFALPVARVFYAGAPQRSSMRPGERSKRAKIWCEGFLIQSAARAPSSSRAPPSSSL